MVSYCCVKGCNNNSNNKKKDPTSILSFHAFPTNQDLKTKWLKAIGRTRWRPPCHSRVCSAHFNHDQLNYDGCRIRLKDDAFPVNLLPANSNFEASNVRACRVCLATDVKMYSLQDTYLGNCMDFLAGVSQIDNINALPPHICYQCAPTLIKCNKLIEKCLAAQATLLDIFAKNGQITKKLINLQNRAQLKLTSALDSYLLTNYYYIKYNDDDTSDVIIIKPDSNEDINNMYLKYENHTSDKKESVDPQSFETKKYSINEYECVHVNEELNNYADIEDVEETTTSTSAEITILDEESFDGQKVKKYQRPINDLKKKLARRKVKGLTPDETDMLKYFDIVKLTLHEQIQEWESTVRRQFKSETVYKCEICPKVFANANTYRMHITHHDPSRGKSEYPVCKLRFRNAGMAKSHANRAHGKKFYCKSCPKAFSNVGVAKKHQRWHSGYLYKCDSCAFSSLHESSLGVHKRRAHRGGRGGRGAHTHTAQATHKDVDMTKDYRCEQCKIDFVSEGARRVHLLTSTQHRKNPDLCNQTVQDPSLRNTCNKCGIECATFSELVAHSRAEHPRVTKHRWRDDAYPTRCELCGETMSCRKKHWLHVRRLHPKEINTYRPVITAVCDTCGKGFQNSTKLHLHQLRHRSPTVRCLSCPRMFYDKYALARHARTHNAEKPHQCRTCGRAFKLRSNLERHSRVHTDIAPYECTMCGKKFKYSSSVNLHVRTVHYKQPHPPRKKRNKSAKNIDL